jgi:hypothetical protein
VLQRYFAPGLKFESTHERVSVDGSTIDVNTRLVLPPSEGDGTVLNVTFGNGLYQRGETWDAAAKHLATAVLAAGYGLRFTSYTDQWFRNHGQQVRTDALDAAIGVASREGPTIVMGESRAAVSFTEILADSEGAYIPDERVSGGLLISPNGFSPRAPEQVNLFSMLAMISSEVTSPPSREALDILRRPQVALPSWIAMTRLVTRSALPHLASNPVAALDELSTLLTINRAPELTQIQARIPIMLRPADNDPLCPTDIMIPNLESHGFPIVLGDEDGPVLPTLIIDEDASHMSPVAYAQKFAGRHALSLIALQNAA